VRVDSRQRLGSCSECRTDDPLGCVPTAIGDRPRRGAVAATRSAPVPDGAVKRRPGSVGVNMLGLYLFAAALGVPLLAWFLLSGGDEGGDGGGDEGYGVLMLRRLPLGTVAIVAATFGICGLALGAAGTGPVATFVCAVISAVVAGVLSGTAFAYLRRSESGATARDDDLAGAIGHVVLPLGGQRRGRIAISVGGQQLYLSARAVPPATDAQLEVGAAILVIEVRDGIASVTPLDPELT